MPWKVKPVSDIRLAFVHQIVSLHHSLTQACRDFNISRKTGYKWLRRVRDQPQLTLNDQSRRPHSSPRRTPDRLEQQVLLVRRRFGWGAPKIHAYLQPRLPQLPSIRTVHAILQRHHLLQPVQNTQPADQRFERGQPNDLWQLDFKGPLEIARQRVLPLSILDDHSRFLLALASCSNVAHATAWNVLWNVMADGGMPASLLCDNAFNARSAGCCGTSHFDAMLIRLGIHPLHGRPYHPQTQGKVERFHGTLQRELWPRVRRDNLLHFQQDLDHWRMEVYNVLRPHEALGQQPPICRWKPSPRKRPAGLPPLEYPSGSLLRKIAPMGTINFRNCRILVGKGLAGDHVRIEERDHDIGVFYAWKEVRTLAASQLVKYGVL